MAALDPKQLQEFKKLLEELNRKKVKLNQDPILDLDETVENLGVVNDLLDITNQNINDLEGSVEGIKESWGSIVGELKKADNLTGSSIKSFNKLSGIADKLSMSQKGLNELSSRQISSLVTKTKIEAENLKFLQKQLEAKGRDEETSKNLIQQSNDLIELHRKDLKLLQKSEEGYDNIKKELNDQIKAEKKKIGVIEDETKALIEIKGTLEENSGLVKQQIDTLKAQEKQTRNVERATGLTGVAMKGISGFLDKIGMSNMGEVFEDANLAAKSTAERLTDGGKKAGGFLTKVRAMGSAFKVVGKAIIRNLTDPLVVAGMLIKGFKAAFNFFANAYKKGEEAAKRISEENVNMARSLGISQKAASKLAGSVAGMGPTTAASKSSIEGIYKAMGSTEKLSRGTLKVFVKLNTMAGMSAESLAKFQKFAKKSGEDAGTLVSAMAKTAGAAIKNNKLAMTQRDLLDETANQSAYVKLQFAGQGPALVKAVAQSKALGLNMKQARDMASSLLNFEDSIAAEMEAELLTGKQLNLEEARALALKGDNVGAAKLIAEQVGGAAEFMSMNVIQQEALAKAAGMGVDEMSNMLSGQQDMKAEGDDLVKNQEDGIKAMTSAVSLREAAENRARAAAEASIPIYKKLSGIVHQLQGTFTEISKVVMTFLGDNILEPMTKFLESEEGKEFLKNLPTYVKNALDKMKELVTTITNFLKDTDSKYPWLKKLLAGAAGTGILLKVTGLDKSLLEGIKKIPGLFSSKTSTSQKLAKAAGVELGEPSNPMFVKVDGSGMNDITDNLTDNMDSIWKGRNVKWMSRFKKFSSLFGGKNSMVGRSLRNLSAMFGKRSSIFKQVFKNLGNKFKNIKMPNLTKIFSKMKMPNLTKIFSKIKMPNIKSPKAPKSKGSFLGNMWNKVKKGASSTFKGAKNLGSKALGGIKSVGSKALGGIKSAGKGISNMGGAAWKGIKSVGSKALGGIKSAVKFLNPLSYLKKYLPKFLKSKAAKGFVSKIPKFGSIANLAMIAADLAMTGASVGAAAEKGVDPQNIGKMVIQGLGDAGGTLLGGALGSFIPIPGVGTLLGGFLGGMAGKALGGLIADNVDAKPIGNWVIKTFGGGKAKDGGSAEDFIMQNGTMTKFRKDDVIVGGTNLGGGGANSEKTNQLLERLIKAVERGGDVILDGQKVGTAMAAGSYRMQ